MPIITYVQPDGTRQVFVDPAWAAKVPAPEVLEESMLEGLDAEGRRLSCQIEVTEALDGLVVRVPDRQY
ncbi:2Fe-2S iron-sulfur cluster-binding family protein [Actibacterium sp. D379-3]